MMISAKDQHDVKIGGTTYWLRTPTPYDLPKMRRLLTRQGVRRPSANELRVAALAGIEGMARATGLTEEGERQAEVLEQWHKLSVPIDENDIDEPDGEKRAALLAEREAERRRKAAALYAEVKAIEANLERHHPPYAELVADGQYWDDISRIDAVRLLLVRTEPGGILPRDGNDLVESVVFLAIPDADRFALATSAMELLAPGEAQRKN